LTDADARRLLHVLRAWEAALEPADPVGFPADFSVEVGVDGCAPPPLRPGRSGTK
jgi:hypothetical protein